MFVWEIHNGSKRKEWVRKVDVEGNAFWYRNGDSQQNQNTRLPGFVVSFSQRDQIEIITGTGKTAALITEAENAQLELTESTKADAAVFPLGGRLESEYYVREVVDQAKSLEFPSKYALFVGKSVVALAPTRRQLVRLNITRKFALEQSFEHLSCMDTHFARADLTIKYIKEPRASTSNLQREWFVQLNELLGSPNTGLFSLANKSDQTFYINRHSKVLVGEDHLTFYYSAGRLLGHGLLNGNIWGFHLATPLLKIILGQPVSFADLEFFDPEEYKNLEWLRKNHGAESLDLDFSVTEVVNDEVVVVDLIPNGRNIPVTDENKHEYLERRFRYTLFESVSEQLYVFLKGIYEVIPQEQLMLLDPEEFDYVLCGTDVIDVDDWEVNSKYNECIHAHPSKKWFWAFVREMPLEYKKRLLHFTTGNTRVPLGGFAALTNYNGRLAPFTIVGRELVTSRLIRGQPCFNHLELPTYVKKKELKSVLFGILDNYDYAE